jgi:hypothetical protein
VDEFETYNGGLLSSLKVALSPNQDLHGYDSPWVGGAGKNKADATYYQATAMYQPVVSASFKVQSGKRYAFSFDTPNSGYTVYRQTPSILGFSSFSEYAFALDGTRKTFYGDCIEDKVISNIQVLGSYSTAEEGETVYVTNFMIEEIPSDSTSSTDYEPYENICPITGHTQVDVDVSDGQTTQEQVTVNLGGTYYSGTLDVVTGVFTPDMASVDLGTLNWSKGSVSYYAGISGMKIQTNQSQKMKAYCSSYKISAQSEQEYNTISGLNWGANIAFWNLVDYSDANQVKTAMSGVQLVYELDTPTPIQLTPQQVKALVGENHLSAPLEGQEITESKYKQTFTFDDVIAYIQSLS